MQTATGFSARRDCGGKTAVRSISVSVAVINCGCVVVICKALDRKYYFYYYLLNARYDRDCEAEDEDGRKQQISSL